MIIALRHGVLVRKATTMRFAADVVHQSAHPYDDDRFTVVPIEAGTAADAARKVAEIAAVRRYDEDGSVGYLAHAGKAGWYRAAIGVQQKSADGIGLNGVTISIHVWAVD
jgi:hypothetical protein